MISELDLASKHDFITFLKVHEACFSAMARHGHLEGLAPMVEAIRRDLTTLTGRPALEVPVQMYAFHPLAGRYILAGSRMGTQVLRKRWLRSENQTVRAADSYFTLPTDVSDWKAVCAELSKIPADGPLASTIKEDTRMLFTCFHATLDTVTAQGT